MLTTDRTFSSLPELDLMHNSVHIWQASLQQPLDVIFQLSATLSDEEQRRADRFHFENLRNSFIVARGILRLLLARYVHCKPAQLQFDYTSTGKPFLSKLLGNVGICFNLSHSNNLVLYAITQDRQVGIDVEYVRSIPEMLDIAERTFSSEENYQIKHLNRIERQKAFFNCWTRKEAFIKAIGDGMSFPLDQFDVSLKPGDPARILKIFGSEEKAERWSMHELLPAERYSAAFVVEGKGCSIEYQDWEHVDHPYSIEEPR